MSETTDGRIFSLLKAFCIKYRCNIVYGFIEAGNRNLYNSQSLITTTGEIASIYRKKNLYLSNELTADRFFSSGSNYSVIKYEGKTIGFGLCMDININNFIQFFETASPDLLFISCCWLEEKINLIDYWCCRLKNISGTVIISNTWGKQTHCEFAGKSCIISGGQVIGALPSCGDCCLVN